MKWLLLLLPLLLQAQVSIRDPGFLARVSGSSSVTPPVSGYTMWIDPSDTSTVFTNNPPTVLADNRDFIRFIKDKSPNGTNNLIPAGNFDWPEYRKTNMFSTGLAGCWLGSLIATNTNLEITTNRGAVTIFVVGKRLSTADSEPTLIGWGDNGRAVAGVQFEDNGGSPYSMRAFTIPSFPVVATSANLTNDVAYAWCVQFDASLGASSFLNIWTGYNKYTAVLSGDPIPIGRVFGVGRYATVTSSLRWGGTWSEVIAYPRALSGLEITNTMNYLIPKWGTRSVP